MAKEEPIVMEGEITEHLPNTRFRVKLDSGHQILAHLAGKLRRRQGLTRPLHQLRRQATFGEGYWTVHGLAQQLDVNRNWLYLRIRQGRLPTIRHPQAGNYLIPQDDQLLASLKRERAMARK